QKNPYLDPFRSNNLDFTAEWYFAQGGVLGASAFYKDIVSLIRSEIVVQSLPVQIIRASGETSTSNLNFNVSRIVNGSGVTVKGFELFYQQAFTFLPAPFDGLGASANYTFIDNSDPEQLTAASRNNFNLTAYYEKGPAGVRLSYAWRGGFLLSPSSAQAMGTRSLAYGTLDGSASLKITDNASLTLEGVNLLNAAQLTQFTSGLPSAYVDAGRRILFGARFSF
ncbi:TonB-dependent receptor domain-containing protein, partial [Sphingobium amiense]|uniref:TonB-dependent receptor domain-containing protein n=2 Tax=Sphingobium TaxID=165695 RepID=UPI000B1BE369